MWDGHEKDNSKSASDQHLLVLKLSTSSTNVIPVTF